MRHVTATQAALEAIARLQVARGPLMFFQSGGCCDGSLPMCLELGALLLGDNDVLLGLVGGSPFYIDRHQYEAWGHPEVTLDVAPGLPEGFSLPAGPQEHFVVAEQIKRPRAESPTVLRVPAED